MIVRYLIAMLLLAVAAVACGDDEPAYTGDATITRHEYDDADDNYVPEIRMPGSTSCTGGYTDSRGYTTPRTCTRSPDFVIPARWDHEPERYLLHVQWTATDDKGVEKIKTKTIQVGYDLYNDCRDGRRINIGEARCLPG